MKWIPVTEKKPRCSRNPEEFGTPVLIWPRGKNRYGEDTGGFCYYGRRATGRPEFYLFGAVVPGVTHWMPMPAGPGEKELLS
jgi:hypothetical protein